MKVLRVEPTGIADVYNMEVEGTHSYIVEGGIVSHNCYDADRYVLMEHPLNPRRTIKRYTAEDPLPPEDPLEIIKESKYGRD